MFLTILHFFPYMLFQKRQIFQSLNDSLVQNGHFPYMHMTYPFLLHSTLHEFLTNQYLFKYYAIKIKKHNKAVFKYIIIVQNGILGMYEEYNMKNES